MVLSKSALPLASSILPRVALCPYAWSVPSPWTDEELRAEGGIGARALRAPRPVHPVPGAGRDERDEGGDEEDERDRHIHEGHEGEDEDGRERRDEELRDVLAEVDLELLDALDHGQDHVARARPREVGGAERGDVVGAPAGAATARALPCGGRPCSGRNRARPATRWRRR
jgi:hypothetical protein